jgi:hypothetical protein
MQFRLYDVNAKVEQGTAVSEAMVERPGKKRGEVAGLEVEEQTAPMTRYSWPGWVGMGRKILLGNETRALWAVFENSWVRFEAEAGLAPLSVVEAQAVAKVLAPRVDLPRLLEALGS